MHVLSREKNTLQPFVNITFVTLRFPPYLPFKFNVNLAVIKMHTQNILNCLEIIFLYTIKNIDIDNVALPVHLKIKSETV